MDEIKKISVFDLQNVIVRSGYDGEHYPEATVENMFIFMNKINELVDMVNKLQIQGLIKNSEVE